MGVPARAAVEAPEGGRAPKERAAAPNADEWRKPRPLVCAAAHGWHAPFGASPPFYCRGRIYFSCVVVGRAWADRRREDGGACASLRASAKQSRAAGASVWIASSLSLLAMTSVYPPPRVSAGEGDRPNGGG